MVVVIYINDVVATVGGVNVVDVYAVDVGELVEMCDGVSGGILCHIG